MGKYTVFDSANQTSGAAMLSFIESINIDRIRPFLEKHGLTNIDPDKWYPLQQWLDVLSDISEQGGAMFDFVSIGMKIIETAKFPPEFEALAFEQAVMAIDDLYHANARGGDIGEYTVEQVGEKQIEVTCRIPFPDDVAYGQLYGMARRMLPKGSHPTVRYDEDIPRREKGGERTIMHVTW